MKFAWEECNELPKVEAKTDMHCVTSWSKLDNVRMGVQAKTLLKMAKPMPEAKFFSAFCDGGYATNALPIEELYEEDVLFTTHHNSRLLEPGHDYPLRLVIPRVYAWKSAKWIRA